MRLKAVWVSVMVAAAAFAPVLHADSAHADKPAAGFSEMMALQFQHIKLWFAGRLGNWRLAAYELDRIESGLDRAGQSNIGLPERKAASLLAVRRAIEARDGAAFAKAYTELTNDCNSCHRAAGLSFITVQVPATSPFTDQLFTDQVAEGRALAHMICGACHVISDSGKETPVTRFPAPSFPELAGRASFSADQLRELLSSNHRRVGPDQTMRNPRLAPYQIDEIVAFFETLRAERAR